MLYGKEEISVESRTVSGTWSQYKFEQIEFNYISEDHKPCISEDDKVTTDLWECMTDHMYSKMNCTLPWALKENDKDAHLCTLPKEYETYSEITMAGLNLKSEYIEKVAKCTPRCKRMEYSAKLVYNSNYPHVSDEWTLKIYFAKDKFPVKKQFYIYSNANLIADFGGYLGLLLGYSVLAFYDSLVDFFQCISMKFKKKYSYSD